jgi:hypothetical protein
VHGYWYYMAANATYQYNATGYGIAPARANACAWVSHDLVLIYGGESFSGRKLCT